MTLPDLTSAYWDHCVGRNRPTQILMGVNALRDYITAVQKLPFENRPYGWRFFNDATVSKDESLAPTEVRFVVGS